MPNWVQNSVTIKHDDPAMLERVVKSFKEGRLLQEFLPCPQELIDTECVYYPPGTTEAEQQNSKETANRAQFGFKNWYDWCTTNWGTKWDIGSSHDGNVDRVGNRVKLYFLTAWNPPLAAYRSLKKLGFRIRAYYYEQGMQFAGTWKNGCSKHYEDWGDSNGAETMLPVKLNKEFAIAENQQMWEEDDA